MSTRRLARRLWLLYTLFIVYGGTIPFQFDSAPDDLANRVQWAPFGPDGLDARLPLRDIAENVLFFVPFGLFGVLAGPRSSGSASRVAAVVAAAVVLSVAVETAQLYARDRTSAIIDVLSDSGGALLGALAAAATGRGLEALGRFAARRGLERTWALYATAIMALVTIAGALEPFDVTINPGSVYAKVKALVSGGGMLAGPTTEGGAAIRAALTASLLAQWLRELKVTAPRARAIASTVTLAIILEGLQCFVASRTPDGADALLTMAAAICGGLAIDARHLRPPRPAPLLTTGLVTLLVAATQALTPGVPVEGQRAFNWTPFLLDFSGTGFATLSHVVQIALLYFPFAFIAASTTVSSSTRWMVSIGGPTLAACALEALQLWTTGRYADVTTPLAALAGAMAGAWCATAGWWMFVSSAPAVPRSAVPPGRLLRDRYARVVSRISPGAAIALIALAVRLTVFALGPSADVHRAYREDSERFVLLGTNLLEHGEFGKLREDGLVHRAIEGVMTRNGTLPPQNAAGFRPELFRTPGYPAVIALGLALGDLRWVLILQVLLGSAAAWAAIAIARDFGFSSRAATAVGLAWALHPALIVYDNLLLSESCFTGLTTWAVLLAARRSVAGPAMAGLLIGLATMMRPVGPAYVPLASLVVLRSGRRWGAVGMLVIVALLPSLAWAARNRAVGGELRVSTVADVNLAYYFAAYVISEQRGDDWFDAWPQRIADVTARLEARVAPGQDVMRAARWVAIEEMAAHPGIAARVVAKSMLKLAVDHSIADLVQLFGRPYRGSGFGSLLLDAREARRPTITWALGVALAWTMLNVAIVGLGLAGFVRGWRTGRRTLVIVCAATVLLFATATLAVGLERFRMPMLLPLFLLAAIPFDD